MKPTDLTKQHVITHYVEPARQKGETTIQVRVGNVQKELGWTNRTPSIFSALSSKSFLKQAGLALLEKRGGPPSGGPSTTVEFLFHLHPPEESHKPAAPGASIVPSGQGLLQLWGILADAYKEFGGGEAYLEAERDAWGPDPWERLKIEREASIESDKEH